jgi:hypothetical protein
MRITTIARREFELFGEGLSALWTACLGWMALRTARYILG